jgi:hypothetical protein
MAATSTPLAGAYTVDPVHSSFGFAVRYQGVSIFRGTLGEVSATLAEPQRDPFARAEQVGEHRHRAHGPVRLYRSCEQQCRPARRQDPAVDLRHLVHQRDRAADGLDQPPAIQFGHEVLQVGRHMRSVRVPQSSPMPLRRSLSWRKERCRPAH